MGVNNKGKRKIVINEEIYWWFVIEDGYGIFAHIISDDKTFIAECRLYCATLRIEKSLTGKHEIGVPQLEEKHGHVFTPQYVRDLIEIGKELP